MNIFFNSLKSSLKVDGVSKDILMEVVGLMIKLNPSLYKRIEIKKDEFLSRPGKKMDKVFFVFNGFMRSFSNNLKGDECTLQFAITYSWISDYISLYGDQNSELFIQAMSDCVIWEFDISRVYKLCEKYPKFSLLYRKGLEQHISALGSRLMNQLQLSAEERYDMFLKTYPGIDQLAMNYHIASFLGITPQSLSRIRSAKKH